MGTDCGGEWDYRVGNPSRILTVKDYDNGNNFLEWSVFYKWKRAGGVCPRGDGTVRAANERCYKGCQEQKGFGGGYTCA
jgi:hypothetical protein